MKKDSLGALIAERDENGNSLSEKELVGATLLLLIAGLGYYFLKA